MDATKRAAPTRRDAGGSKKLRPLVFGANFESGNIGRVTQVNDHEYDLEIRPDTNNSRHRVWFFFCVSNVSIPGQRTLFHITNFSKSKSLYREGMAPLVRSSSRSEWQLVPEKHVFYYRCPKHRRSYVMSFAFEFDAKETFYFAYSYPYTYTELQNYLHSIDVRKLPFFQREVLCKTVQGRRVDLITITEPDEDGEDGAGKGSFDKMPHITRSSSGDPSDVPLAHSASAPYALGLSGVPPKSDPIKADSVARHGESARAAPKDLAPITARGAAAAQRKPSKPMIFITCRVHPGETPASYICHGLLECLISDSEEAKRLRALFVWKIVPMLNPDGVFLGNYRCSYLGDDLNRHWLAPSFWAHREIASTKAKLVEYFESPDAQLDCYIDIHAHTTAYGSFMYCNSAAGPSRFESESLLPRLLHARSPDFFYERTKFDQDPKKRGTGRRTLGALLGPKVNCYTLEVSFFATSASPASAKATADRKDLFTPAKYLRLGHDLALTFLDYHGGVHSSKSGGVASAGIPPPPSTATTGGAGRKARPTALRLSGAPSRGMPKRIPITPIRARTTDGSYRPLKP